MSRWRGNGSIIGGLDKRNYQSSSNSSDGVWGLESKYNLMNAAATGSAIFETAGDTTFTVPAGVTSISIVVVGGGGGGAASTTAPNGVGGGGGGGGGLAYKNNISVTPGQSFL